MNLSEFVTSSLPCVQLDGPGVSLHFTDNVARIRFHSPNNKNAVTQEIAKFLFELTHISAENISPLQLLIQKFKSQVIVLESTLADIFISGGDLKQLAICSSEQGILFTQHMRYFCKSLRLLNIPSICLLNSCAYGGGAEIALSTDYRWITGQNSSLHFWQSRWGLPGGWNGMARLKSLVPQWDSRRIGLLFALQESFFKKELLHYGLAEADLSEFSVTEINESLQQFIHQIQKCPQKLRHELLNRNQSVQNDDDFFDSHWLSDDHKKALQKYLSQRNSNAGSV